FRDIVGIESNQFTELHSNCEQKLKSIDLQNLDNQLSTAIGRPRALSTQSHLLITLIWLKQYMLECTIAWVFQIPHKQVYQYTRSGLKVLFDYFAPTIC